MDVFNVHRRDLFDFDEFMDLKKPGFGGPSSALPEKDNKGKQVQNGHVKLEGYRNVVERHPSFSHEVFNPTYKAMGSDLVHQQEVGKNPYDYADPYENTGIPVVDVTKGRDSKTNESLSVMSYDDFMVNEQQVAPARPARETETEERPSTTPTTPGTRPNSPTRPPRRRVNPAPKNANDGLVKALATELGIPEEEAAWLLSDDGSSNTNNDTEDNFYADIDYDSDGGDISMGSMGSSDCGCD